MFGDRKNKSWAYLKVNLSIFDDGHNLHFFVVREKCLSEHYHSWYQDLFVTRLNYLASTYHSSRNPNKMQGPFVIWWGVLRGGVLFNSLNKYIFIRSSLRSLNIAFQTNLLKRLPKQVFFFLLEQITEFKRAIHFIPWLQYVGVKIYDQIRIDTISGSRSRKTRLMTRSKFICEVLRKGMNSFIPVLWTGMPWWLM